MARVLMIAAALSTWTGSAVMAQNSAGQSTQSVSIQGVVVGSDGEPLIGASVRVSGNANAGAATDLDGRFTLPNVPGKGTLIVSYVGYVTKEVPYIAGKAIDITLQEDAQALDEVVVVGYGTQKKVNLTGSVAALSAKEIADKPVANTATLLQGRMPGLVLTNNGAQAGNDNPEIRIRGVGTFGNNNPMLLIDGVECGLGQLSEIPAADIESVSVLKDAASAAIYGVRAANGVILVTTKKGQDNGKVNINYQGSYTLQTPGKTPDYVDAYQYALLRNESDLIKDPSKPVTYDEVALEKIRTGSDPDHYANVNWIDEVLRNAPMWQHHFSVSGANKSTNYMTSLSYNNQDGIVPNTAVERISFRANVNSAFKRLTFGMNAYGQYTDVTEPSTGIGGNDGIMNFISWFTRPTVPVKYQNGHWGYIDGSDRTNANFKNPLDYLSRGHCENHKWLFNGKAWAAVDIWGGIKYQLNLAYNFYLNSTKKFSEKGVGAAYDAEGNQLSTPSSDNSATDYWYRDSKWTIENLLTFNRDFGAHTVGVILGQSAIGYRYYSTTASKKGFPTNNIYELSGGTTNPTATGGSQENRLQSFFGRVNYSYDGRYLFEFNIRHDGSSRMPKKHRYGTFPSVSAGWVFSNEKFAESWTPILNHGKIRASWGKLGNQEIGNYPYSATLAASGNYYFDQSKDKQIGMVQTSVPNEDIHWETTRTINVGFDLGFLNNRISTTFDFFDKRTSDILMTLAMPGIFLGNLGAPYQNVGKVQNRGFEWAVNYMDSHGDWTWNVGFSISHVKNKILEMGDQQERISGRTVNRVGEPIGSYYALKAIGMYRSQEDVDNRRTAEGNVVTQFGQVPKPGDLMYADIDGNGDVGDDDRDIIGNPFPKFSYGINLGATWKGVDFSAFFQGVSGINRYCYEPVASIRANVTTRVLDHWMEDNPNASRPGIGREINDKYSSFWLEDASYLRLKNLELGYTFRQNWLKKVSLSSVRFYFEASNLLTFTKLKNYDPEKTSGDERGYVHPYTRNYSFGVNVQF